MNLKFFLKIEKIIIENNSLNTKSETIGNALASVGWAAGPYLTKIQIGNLEKNEYSEFLSESFINTNKKLIK